MSEQTPHQSRIMRQTLAGANSNATGESDIDEMEENGLDKLEGTPAKPGSFRDRFALSEQGYHALVTGSLWSMVGNLSLMIPISIIVLTTDALIKRLDDPNAALPNLWMMLGLIIVTLVVMYAAQWMQYAKTYNAVYGESARARISIAEKLRTLPMSFFSKRDVADLTTAILTDCANVEQVFSHVMPELIGTIGSTILVAVALFFVNWQLALASLWVIPVCFLVLWATRRIQTRLGAAYNERRLVVASQIQEGLECMSQLRASGQTSRFMDSIGENIDRTERAQISGELIPGTIVTCVGALLNLGKATTILVGAGLILAGRIDFMTYFLFLLVAAMIYTPIAVTFESTAELFNISTHTERLRAIQHEPMQTGGTDFHPDSHDIVFQDVSFDYGSGTPGEDRSNADTSEPVLNDVYFTARQGEVTALFGPSGSGKSTVSKLAARFWDPSAGTVSVGGVDVTSVLPEALLRDYAMVFQDVVLFNDTVMENIRLGRRDATDDEVRAAAKAANCSDFIARLPSSYETVIGENGETLSGGERQRISIARALLKNAPIVLLDEATASLDAENETQIQQALSRLLADKTVLMIAHRMRTVATANKVIVLDRGRVVEEGAPGALMQRGGMFAHMVALQTQSAQWTLDAKPRG